MVLNPIEEEIVFLYAILQFIDQMINKSVFDFRGQPTEMELYPHTEKHQQYFYIILTDFLSCTDKDVVGKEIPYLRALKNICDNPLFEKSGSITHLTKSTEEFKNWLETEVNFENLHFATIGLETSLKTKRREFIKICGNLSKHSFSRLSLAIKELISVFNRCGTRLTEEECYSILDDLYQIFNDSVLNYHNSTIAEFLNNIRWAIYQYLEAEYQRAIEYTEETNGLKMYRFNYPADLKNEFAKKCYWDLMSKCHTKTNVPLFKVNRFLKTRY